ncbi:MFS transporter [Oceanicoccus sp. KOV_DT_Chl]|uniref:MFS transporter n=1 Tax=Oceanicoccus sp. KOV_DT_Chl TaxID=1904639 RepID=UPI00350FAA40
MAVALATPFYIDLGFSLTEIGVIAKNAALWPSIVGGLLGGVLMIKIGINRALWWFGGVQIITIFGFALLAEMGDNPWVLALVISLEYLGVGLGTAAITAFMARATNPVFAATQFALLSALATVPRTFSSALSGVLVENMGWTQFYFFCAALAVPGMLLLFKVAPWHDHTPTEQR